MVILVRGIPGSGKTTFVSREFGNILRLENDFFHYHRGIYDFDPQNQMKAVKWCLETLENAVSLGMDVVVSNTYTKTSFIDEVKRIALKYGTSFIVYRMCGDFKNIHNVPKNVLERMKIGFEDYKDEILVVPTKDGYEYKNQIQLSNLKKTEPKGSVF